MIIKRSIPKGIRLITWSTSVRWFGWGLSELFIPVFILLFSSSFLEAGLISSVFEIVFLLSIPIAGFLADRIKIKKILLLALIIYVFIGLGYFLAGITGAIIFLIIARALNGASYCLDQVGRETYITRHSPKSKVSRIFGRFDFITTFWYIFAVLVGLVLINYVELYWLFFIVTPTSIISFFIILRLKEKKKNKRRINVSLKSVYYKMFKEIKNFNKGLRLIAILSFFLGIISSVIYLFVPISAYLDGESIVNSAILLLVYSIPILFAQKLGKIADKKKEKIYVFGILSIILVLFSLIYFKNYFAILITLFFASAIFELIYLTNMGMIARLSDRTHLGEIDGSLNGIATVGAIIGPILFGLFTDLLNINNAYFILVFLSLIMFGLIFKGRKFLKTNR